MGSLSLGNKGMSTRDKDMGLELKKLADEEMYPHVSFMHRKIEGNKLY